jgi:hypothetical protein
MPPVVFSREILVSRGKNRLGVFENRALREISVLDRKHAYEELENIADVELRVFTL